MATARQRASARRNVKKAATRAQAYDCAFVSAHENGIG